VSGRHDGDGETAGWLRGQLAEALGRLRKADSECARLAAELEEARQHIKAQNEVDRILAMGLPVAASGDTGPIARVQGPRAAAHRAPGERHLRVVKVIVFAATLSGLGFRGWRAGAVRAGLAALVTVPAVSVAASPAAGAHEHAPGAAAPNPAASIYSAVPILPPSAVAVTRPRPGLDVRSSRVAPPVSLLLPYVPVPSQAAGAVPPSPEQPQASQPAAGTLAAAAPDGTEAIDLGSPAPGTADLTATIDLSASGGDLRWAATPATASADLVSLDHHRGWLADGGTGAVTVTVTLAVQDQGGQATVTFWPSGQVVTVTWEAMQPAVTPSDAVTDAPADTPSPAAS